MNIKSNNTENELKDLKELFNYKNDLFNFLNNNLLNIYKLIVSILNNNQNNFLFKIIGNEEFNKILLEINCLYNKYNQISSNLDYNNLNDKIFYDIKIKINKLEDEIKEFTLKSTPTFIMEIIELFFKDFNNIIDLNNLDIISIYNNIFTPYLCTLENKSNFLNDIENQKDGFVFLKKLNKNKNNVMQDLHGCKLCIFIKNKIFSFSGYFKNDNVNILRGNKIFSKKNKNILELLNLENISEVFKTKYLEQISLRDFLLYTIEEIKDIILDANSKQSYYKKLSLSSLLFTFSNGNFEKQREILTILTLSDSRSAGLASLLYDVLLKKNDSSKAKHLYMSLHISIQKLFDIAFEDFNKQEENFKNVTEEDIPYDKRILMLDVDEKTKSKALDKFKSISGGLFGNSDNKSQQWLDGFLKIPFGVYKENPILGFKSNFIVKINKFVNIVKEYNESLYHELSYNELPNTDTSIDKYIQNLDSILFNSTKYKCENLDHQQNLIKHFKLINKEWNSYKDERIDYINNVNTILNKAVYGNKEGKKQIECLIGQWINGESNGIVLGFQGPPGVGKTTLAKKGLCKCLNDGDGNRPFAFISLGGSSNGSTLEGHNYTYVGSTWGKIADVLMDSKCMNPIIFFDELDKISNTEHGKEITGILTHLTDVTQNDTFCDKYFSGIDIDLSKAMIIFSYNDSSLIDPILRDRITEIRINPLTTIDKLSICKEYLYPEILKNLGYNKNDIMLKDEDLTYIIDTYTFEAGVRKIKEKLIEIFRIINLERLHGEDVTIPYEIKRDKIEEILSKKPKILIKKITNKPSVGLVNGLYATTVGVGGLTIIEATKTHSDSNFSLELTGQQGDVMKESMKCAKTIAWNLLPLEVKKKINDDWKENGSWGLHVHTPEAATPKDGPSAGGAITLCILSQLTGIPVKNNVAMTGEIDLCGNIKQIGGLISKLNGAKQAGVNLVLIPEENQNDLEIIRKDNLSPEDDTFEVKVIYTIYDILEYALVENNLKFVKN